MSAPGEMTLIKYEGAGNDFLVVVDPDDRLDISDDVVRTMCDRHFGIGADGFIVLGGARPGAPISMALRNADGSVAEMSGNGMRCLTHAAVAAALVSPPTFNVATDAGVRVIDYRPSEDPDRAWVGVEMGPVTIEGTIEPPVPARHAVMADVGNPHLVLIDADVTDEEVGVVGAALQGLRPGGINVEFISVIDADELVLRVFERGVGITLACGTGTMAAAAVAHHLGLVESHVEVHNPGGTLEVELGNGLNVLSGPVRRIGRVSVSGAGVELRR